MLLSNPAQRTEWGWSNVQCEKTACSLTWLVFLGAERSTGVRDESRTDESCSSNGQSGVVLQENKLAATPVVKVVPPGTKTVNITKGFDVPTEKPEPGKCS